MKSFVFSVMFIFASNFLFAWGQNGHRITAQICYDNLSDAARKKVDAALGNDFLTQVATWPDYIRSEKKWDFAKNWHFITVDPGTTAEEVLAKVKDNGKIDNVIEAIELMKKILEGDKASINFFEDLMKENDVTALNNSTEATAIAFLIHFIGDVHQPLHVGKSDDFGGNSVKVLWFDEPSNLHSVWDEGLIQQEQLSFTEFAEFVHKHSVSEKEGWETASITEWADESVAHRNDIYARMDTNLDGYPDKVYGLPNMSYQYQHDFLPVIEDRLGAGGYRAAYVFNQIFK